MAKFKSKIVAEASIQISAATINTVLVLDSGGNIISSPVLSSELAQLSGVSSPIVTTTSTQTLTNKTLTAPVINSPTGLVKADVGLSAVDNTSDVNKPISSAQTTALALKAPLASPTFTGTVSGIDKTMIGLANVDNTSDATKNAAISTLTNKTLTSPVINTPTGIVKADVGLSNIDNTSDANKPISTATQTALNLKANLASPTFTGTVSGITSAMVGLGNVDNTSDSTKNSAVATLTNKTITSPLGIVKSDVGLANVDNTSDVNKPVSTAQQNALNLKADLASPTFTGTVSGITKSMVGLSNVDNTSDSTKNAAAVTLTNKTITSPLGLVKADVGLSNVDNTSDVNKPVSTAQGVAIGLKIDLTQKGAALGVATLDANSLIPITQIPPAALERLVIVANQAARFALTTATVQNGDTVKENDTGLTYFVTDDTNLGNAAGYVVYTAGTASSVAWAGVTGTPTTLAGYGITNPVITALTGDVTASGPGSVAATVVSVGTSSATNVHNAELAANAATNLNTVSTIVKRDASGNFSAGTITANLTGIASNVTTNANLTGPITSVGNATSIASQTGTGSTFVMSVSPTLTTPVFSGLAAGSISGNAATATTAVSFSGSLSGDVTGTQSVTVISASTVTGKAITGFISGAGTVTASDTILTSINKLDGNIAALAAGVAGDIAPTSFSAANNQVSAANITGLAFAAGSIRSFKSQVSVSIVATSSLFEIFELSGIQTSAGFSISVVSNGDNTGVVFSVTSGGQVQYTSSNVTGFTSDTIKFRATVTSV